MTDLSLQDTLADDVRKLFKDRGRELPWAQGLRKLHVYTQHLPIKTSVDADKDSDGDSGSQWNFVCIVLGDEELKDGKWQIEVHFSVGIKDLDKECQGHRGVGNILNEIFLYFASSGFVHERYRMDAERAFKKFSPDDEYPYYQGDLITFWELDAAQIEGLEELI